MYKNGKRLIAICFVGVIFLISVLMLIIFNVKNSITVFADTNIEEEINNDLMLDDDFEDNSIIVVLDEKTSKFKGVSNSTYKKFQGFGIKSIKDLTALPNSYLNSNGNIDSNKAPKLAEYYDKNPFKQILKITLNRNDKQNVLNSINKIMDIEGVFYACPNMSISYGNSTTDDPKLSEQWGLTGSNGINASAAWDITPGSHKVRVGVIDSGITSHEDLIDNLVEGRDFYHNNNITNDPIGDHGTHVAGIIGAIGNNGIGISGVSQNVSIVPLQTAFDTSGAGRHYNEEIVAAITYARDLWDTDERISILNYSILGFGKNTEILSNAKNFPGLFVWCAGNEGENVDKLANSELFNAPNIISVGALDKNGKRWSGSNYGQNSVDIYAPGVDIVSTVSTNKYERRTGTSMAAPHVTGVAALMLSKNPNLTAAQLKTCLLGWADTITISAGGSSQRVKKLNAYNCVKDIENVDSYHRVFLETTNNPEGTRASKQFLWIKNGDPWPTSVDIPTAPFGYEFKGYFYNVDYSPDTRFAIYWENGNFNQRNYYFEQERFYSSSDITLQARWMPKPYYFVVSMKHSADWDHPLNIIVTARNYEESLSHAMDEENTVNGVKKKFTRWDLVILDKTYEFSTDTTLSITVKDIIDRYCPDYDELGKPSIYFYAIYDTNVSSSGGGTCITPGSLITLADGTKMAVEDLTGNEMLLVWDMRTGSFASAPILFIDIDEVAEYQIINLSFSDGTTVDVIYEHAFWDCNLNEYVFLREDAAKYIGHWFNKQTTDDYGNLTWTSVQLTEVTMTQEYTTAYSPVTYGHLCYYVNGMLSMPGATEGLINIFEVDSATMTYDKEAYERDIQSYGLYTYEEFCEIMPVSEEVFNAFNGQYLKVAIGKNLLTENDLITLYARYSKFFS